jgi:hypothetical protein
MRGRKFYWHLSSVVTGQWQNSNQATYPVQVEALPANSKLTGRVHFLTGGELGALLVCLDPNLYFHLVLSSKRRYGWKIGKGKSRGLGSVEAQINKLELWRTLSDAYKELDAVPLREAKTSELNHFVTEFAKWITPNNTFVKDLEHLLCLPTGNTGTRDYCEPSIQGAQGWMKTPYGWMPDFGNPHGEPRPTDGRPPAMKAARKINVP